jgi:hypothetical protein
LLQQWGNARLLRTGGFSLAFPRVGLLVAAKRPLLVYLLPGARMISIARIRLKDTFLSKEKIVIKKIVSLLLY